MPVELETYLSFAEIQGRSSTIEEFRRELLLFSRDAVVFVCSALNCLLKTEGNIDLKAHETLLKEAFPTSLYNILDQLRKRGDGRTSRIVFHRLQLLFVVKEAIRICPTDGRDATGMPYWGGLGLVLLMANDHLLYRSVDPDAPDKKIISTLADFIPITEYSGRMTVLLQRAARSILMSTKFLEAFRGRKEFVDIPDYFQKATGLSLPEYQALCVGLMSSYMALDYEAFRQEPASFRLNTKTWGRNTSINGEKIDAFLRLLSGSPEMLRDNFKRRDHGINDFTWMRDKPLFEGAGGLFPFDTLFLAEKLETGYFWRVHEFLTDPLQKERLHSFWGLIFQDYMHWLLSFSVDESKNIYIPSPRYANDLNAEACDALILCGSSAALIEYKGDTFTAEGKYSGSPELLEAEIEKKLVGTSAKRKGLGQLADAMRKLFRKDSPEKLANVDLSRIRTIYPVLVTRDDIGGALVMNLYLARKFGQLLSGRSIKPRVLTPFFCMSADELETISAYLKEAEFTSILEARYRADPILRSTFTAVDNAVLRTIGLRRNPILEDAYATAMDEFCGKLFPGKVLEHFIDGHRITQQASRLNAEARDVMDYQSTGDHS